MTMLDIFRLPAIKLGVNMAGKGNMVKQEEKFLRRLAG